MLALCCAPPPGAAQEAPLVERIIENSLPPLPPGPPPGPPPPRFADPVDFLAMAAIARPDGAPKADPEAVAVQARAFAACTPIALATRAARLAQIAENLRLGTNGFYQAQIEAPVEALEPGQTSLPVAPLIGLIDLGPIETHPACPAALQQALPKRASLRVDAPDLIQSIALDATLREALSFRFAAAGRVLPTKVTFRPTGFTVEAGALVIAAEVVALDIFWPGGRRSLRAFDAAAIEALYEERSQRLDQMSRSEETRRRVLMDVLATAPHDRVSRIALSFHTARPPGAIYAPHPARSAALDRLGRADRAGYVIAELGPAVNAAASGRRVAAWPQPLAFVVGEDWARLPERGWVIAFGRVRFDSAHRGDDPTALLPAIVEPEWVYACVEAACAEADSIEKLVDLAFGPLAALPDGPG